MSERKGPLGLWDFPVLNNILGYNAKIQRSRVPGSKYVVAVLEDKKTISHVFARAPYFMIIENESIIKEVINPYVSYGGGAGPKAVEFISQYNPSYVVAGSFGGYAKSELKKRGISVIQRTGTVQELLKP